LAFSWWQWCHAHIDSNGVERVILAAEGSDDEGATSNGVWNCFYTTTYGKTGYYQQYGEYCLNTRVSGWNTGNRPAGIWSISTTVSYLFFIRSGQVYFVKRDDNADTWSAQTQVTTGSGTITKLLVRPVGAGQSTKLYLITDNGGKVFVWDWSTESSVSSSFTIAAFPTHMPKDAPINIGSDYYHFHWVFETRTLYRWKYTSSTYTNPTLTTFSVPSMPGYTNEWYIGFSIEFNTSTSELYAVAYFRNRTGWYPTGDWHWRMRYAEATATTPSWSSTAYLIGKRQVMSNGGDPWSHGIWPVAPGTSPDGSPWSAYGVDDPICVSVYSAYSHGSNNALRRTAVLTTLETVYYTNPEEENVLRTDGLFLNFWEDGVAFYADAGMTVAPETLVGMEGVTNADGQLSCVITTSVMMNESYSSEYNFSSKYDIEAPNFNVDGEIFIAQTTVVGMDGSLASDNWVAGQILIDITTTVALDATSTPTLPLELSFHVPWMTLGTSYHEEFLLIVNAKRAEYGLPPYLLPTEAMYVKWTDVAQLHADNMAATRTFAHESASLPSEWDTYLERFAVSGAEGMAENIKLDFPEQYINYPVWDDNTILSPQEAFDAWWNSPGHRENLLRDWSSESIYSWFGISLGQVPASLGYDDVGFYLCHVMGRYGPEATVMAQKDGYFHISYDSVGAMIESLNVSYDLDTYANVRAAHSGSYSLRVARGHSVDYGARVAVAHEAPIYYNFTATHQMDYSGTVRVRAALETPYRIFTRNLVQRAHASPYAVRISTDNVAPYSVPPPVRRAHECNYSVPVPVTGSHTLMYGDPPVVRAANAALYGEPLSIKAKNEAPWSILTTVRAAHTSGYEMTQPVHRAFEGGYDILSVNLVQQEHRTFYSLSGGGAGIPVTNLVTLTVPGG